MIDSTGCTITLFSQDGCDDSHFVKEWLDSESIPFRDRNVSHDEAAAIALVETGIFATPLVTICDHHVFGNRPDQIERTIRQCEKRTLGSDGGKNTVDAFGT